MKEIRNKTMRALRVPLPAGKSVFLGATSVAQISDAAAESAAIQELVSKGTIEILDAGANYAGTKGSSSARQRMQNGPKSFRRGSGDR